MDSLDSGEENKTEDGKEGNVKVLTAEVAEVKVLGAPGSSRRYQRSSTRPAPGTVRKLMARFQE